MSLAIRKPTGGDVAPEDGPQELPPADTAPTPSAPGAVASSSRVQGALSRFAVPVLAGAAILLGIVVRAIHTLPKPYPPNDGGLFYAMVRDLQANNYLLPQYTSYNSGSIPYAYAPLGFYLTAILNDVTRIPLMTLFTLVPFVATAAMMPAFYVLARAILPAPMSAVIATFVFALIPRSFIWMLMGGGITRSLGLLFAIIALHRVYKLYTTGNIKYLFPTTIYASLCVLSHLETGQFLAYSILVFLFFYGAGQKAMIHSVAVAAGVAAITAPWWGMVLYYHGLAPFQAAHQTGISIFSGEAERAYIADTLRNLSSTTSEPFFPVLYRLAILGGITCILSALATISKKGFLLPGLPVWWLAIILLDNRAASTYTTLAIALLAGLAATDFIFPLLNQPLTRKPYSWQVALFSAQRLQQTRQQWISPVRQGVAAIAAVAVLGFAAYGVLQPDPVLADKAKAGDPAAALYTRVSGEAVPPVQGELASLAALTPADVAAMGWVADETPATSQFLIISQQLDWTTDKTSEWFPVLANRPSVVTPQGYEWLPDRVFIARIQQHWGAQLCIDQDGNCIENWAAATGHTFDYVYVRLLNPNATMCCTLVPALMGDPRYTLVYSGSGAVIFARHPEQPGR